MISNFRDIIHRLKLAGELQHVSRPVDIRYVPTLVEESEKALLFENVIGYDMPILSGITKTSKRCELVMGGDVQSLYKRMEHGAENPIDWKIVNTGPAREVSYQVGDEVDLYSLPVPLFAQKDGGPMITPGVIIAKDEGEKLNAGIYRLMIDDRNHTGIDITTPNDLRRIVERNTRENKSTHISVNIGNDPIIFLASTLMPPAGHDELTHAGGALGMAVELTPCQTVDVPCIADSEIVLEAEILPDGWRHPEGRFGEFHRAMGALHFNPRVRVHAIFTRKNPIYYAFHMPWEVVHLGRIFTESHIRKKLEDARLKVKDVNVTEGGSCLMHAVVSLSEARPGEGKAAILAAMNSTIMKHIVVVDDDIDVHDPIKVEWAIATRVQADKDVVIMSDLPAKPLDPSLELFQDRLPTTSKMGIDATMPAHLPATRFDAIEYCFDNEVDTDAYLNDEASEVAEIVPIAVDDLAQTIKGELENGGPQYYNEVVKTYWRHGFRVVASALGHLHEQGLLWKAADGKICLRDSTYAAKQPASKLTSRA